MKSNAGLVLAFVFVGKLDRRRGLPPSRWHRKTVIFAR
jgi:hypothetical protein